MTVFRGRGKAKKGLSKPARLCIYGWYGIPNLGDEAILASMVRVVRKALPNVHISILTFNSDHTLGLHDVDEVIDAPARMSWRQRWAAWQVLYRSDVFVLGGGGFFHGSSGRRPWFEMLIAAKWCGCHTIVHSVGVDDSAFRKWHWRWIWRGALMHATDVSVRDEYSQQLILSTGFPREVQVFRDPVFLLRDQLVAASALGSQPALGGSARRVCAVVMGVPTYRIVEYSAREYISRVADCIDLLVQELDCDVVFVPFDLQQDRDIEMSLQCVGGMRESARAEVLTHEASLSEVIALFEQSEFVVAARLHALILAIVVATPAIVIDYQAKVATMAQLAGVSDNTISLGELNVASFAVAFRGAHVASAATRERFGSIGEDMRTSASSGMQVVVDALRSGVVLEGE